MVSTPGFELGPHWWEARALTNAPPYINGLIGADRQLLFVPLTKSFPTDVIQEIRQWIDVRSLNKLLFLQLYFAIAGVCQTGS